MKQRWRFLALAAAVLMLAVACSDVNSGGSSPSGSGGAAVPDNKGTTIRFAINPWLGAAINVAVAQVLLEQKLGYTVTSKTVNENLQFPSIANGTLDATLEIWPSGHAADYKKYIQGNAGVVDGGKLGVIGQIGWWIPTYMLQDHPELATWEGLKTDADLFKTAESGSAGQILDGDPSYVTFDQAIANNLGLNLKAIYSGSEDTELAALKAAYAKQAPLLMYFWTPHWAQEQYKLTMVKLPDVTPACNDAAANNPDAYACAYPEDDLYKAFNVDLQTKAPAAFAFLSAMNYTNDDQNAINLQAHDLIDGGMSQSEATLQAAQQWVDANPTVWQPWVDAGLAAQSSS